MVLVWAGVLTQSTALASCCFPTTRDEATYTRQALALASNPDCASSSSDSPARAWHIQDRTSGFHWGVRAAAGLVTVAVTDGPCAQASLCTVLESVEVSRRAVVLKGVAANEHRSEANAHATDTVRQRLVCCSAAQTKLPLTIIIY